MSMMAICPSCGHKNPLGRMFCMQCGVSLSSAPAANTRGGDGGGAGIASAFKVIGKLIRWALILALGYAIFLILMPAVPQGTAGDAQAAHLFERKLQLLSKAIQDNKAATLEVTEAEINGYLAELFRPSRMSQAEGGFGLAPCQLNVTLHSNQVVMVLLSTLRPLTGTNMSHQVVGTVKAGGGAFSFEAQEAVLGSLPMPGPLRDIAASHIATLLNHLKSQDETLQQAADLLKRIDELAVQDAKVLIRFKGR